MRLGVCSEQENIGCNHSSSAADYRKYPVTCLGPFTAPPPFSHLSLDMCTPLAHTLINYGIQSLGRRQFTPLVNILHGGGASALGKGE